MLTSHPRAAALLVALAHPGCGGGEKVDEAGSQVAAAVVGAEGGTIRLDNGVSVTVPAGALTEDVELGIEYVEDVDALDLATLPEGVESGDGALVLTPHGTVFAEPVTVTMPTTLDDEDLGLWRLPDEDGTEWEPDGAVTIEDGLLSFNVLEFSVYSPSAVARGACPCFNGADLNAWATSTVALYVARVRGGPTYVFANKRGGGWIGTGGMASASSSTTDCRGPTGSVVTTTTAQHNACNALIFARFRFKNRSNLQVGAFATGLSTGQTVALDVTTTPTSGAPVTETLTLAAGQELSWMAGLVNSGTNVSATVRSAPAGSSCVVSAGTGVLGTDNVAVQVDCSVTSGACDDDLSGVWDAAPVEAGGPFTISGTKASFSFDVPGGTVSGTVRSDNSIEGVVSTDNDVPLNPGSVYACDPAGAETMTLAFTIDSDLVIVLTAR